MVLVLFVLLSPIQGMADASLGCAANAVLIDMPRKDCHQLRAQLGLLVDYDEQRSQCTVCRAKTEKTVFSPALDQEWQSTYGAIDWQKGWYGQADQTLRIEHEVWSEVHQGLVVIGRWGRRSNNLKHGGFQFVFSGPCEFSGHWWYAGSDLVNEWRGECRG